MFGKKTVLTIVLATMLSAQNVFTIGKTYDFAEEDLIVAIQKHISANEKQIKNKFADMKKKAQVKINKLSPTLSAYPTPAIKDNIFYPDTSYVNPKEIKDHTGKVLYPAGYKFDPMDYISLTYDIIFINGEREEEISWIKQSKYIGNASGRIIITQGEFAKVTKELGQNVFFATDQIINRLQIQKTPSIASQIGNRLQIEEIFIRPTPVNINEDQGDNRE